MGRMAEIDAEARERGVDPNVVLAEHALVALFRESETPSGLVRVVCVDCETYADRYAVDVGAYKLRHMRARHAESAGR